MPGGAGRKRDEDKTHKSPQWQYLHGTHNLEQFFDEAGEQKASPPVLGDWPERPQPDAEPTRRPTDRADRRDERE
jgi:hypothetical protein